MATYRFYTRSQDLNAFEQYFVALDLTRKDFRSSPPLDYYIKNWFIDLDDLIDFLLSISNQKITLITSHLFTNIVHHTLRTIFPQIIRMIIIGKHSHQYDNVEYFFNVQTFVDSLSLTLRNHQRLHIRFDTWPIERTSHDLNKHTAQFLWYNYFYTILSCLKNTRIARAEMLESIKAFHTKQIDAVKQTCEEFEETYISKDIIKWYTKESFFYLLLNRTLRSLDINHIFAMRYVIFDLENNLREHCHENHSINTVYRGQQMHSDEIQQIQGNIGNLIGLTAFWSTSRSIAIARDFTEIWPPERTDSIERVLFTIAIPSHLERVVYFDISQYCGHEIEFEILFSFRSLFRIERALKDENDEFWSIDLTLIDENDDQFISIMHPWDLFTNKIISYRSFFTLQTTESKANFFRNLTIDNGPFLAFQLLIDIMLRLDQNEFARLELLEVCRTYYTNNCNELKNIDEFERNYKPKEAIKWYTTNCFIYRIINHSLRIESIDLIFKLRYIIHDLHNQLAQMQIEFIRQLTTKQAILKLYRGLTMNLNELEEMQQNQGNLISTNSFLSTTSNYQAARFFSGDGNVNDSLISVIYKIYVDTTVKHSIPFANIDYLSIFKDEDEILFSMGAIFRVGEIKQLKSRLWSIELTLTAIEDEQWNILTAHLNKAK